jgi:c-di-GMP-binding flagellar brake protein YcgR
MNTSPKKAKSTARRPARKKVPASLSINRRREWRLELPLNAEIEGKLPHGGGFRERTKLENISSGGAYFCLDSGVVVGSKFNLVIELPNQLTEGRKMKMRLGGIIVRLEKPDKKAKKQGVAVRFTKEFKVIPDKEKK